MSDDVEIARATAADLDAIVALEQAAFPAPWRREFFEGELTSPGRFSLVARRGSRLVGYLFAMYFFDELHINKIAVTAADRRQGIANRLMEHCTTFAVDNGVTSLSLEVRASNHSAQEFYRVLDFRPSYVRPRYYPDGESAVVMTKKLEE
jgi:[ribosomal protein S18]-alanine N-acetyltransferase